MSKFEMIQNVAYEMVYQKKSRTARNVILAVSIMLCVLCIIMAFTVNGKCGWGVLVSVVFYIVARFVVTPLVFHTKLSAFNKGIKNGTLTENEIKRLVSENDIIYDTVLRRVDERMNEKRKKDFELSQNSAAYDIAQARRRNISSHYAKGYMNA